MMEVPGRNLCVATLVVALAMVLAPAAAAGESRWTRGATLPLPRTDGASFVLGGKIGILGGFLADGKSSPRVDLYDPASNTWSRLPDLPVAANHQMAAADSRRVYVVGGYAEGAALRDAFALEGGSWRRLPPLPEARAAGGAAILGGKLYVVGGVVQQGRLAREAFVYDPASRRWSSIPGPTPREHLGVAALGRRIYAVGGRSAGYDTNLDVVEAYLPAERRWRELPEVPGRRGGTGLAAGRGMLVSVGGEAPLGTIAEVYAYETRARGWRRLPDLPTPRHGLGVEFVGGRIYAIAGGPEPGLTVSGVNESIALS
jgi:N-acetylneuraminic acid mutarotase